MSIQLKDLPYSKKDLEPYISEETINYHYGKHHQAYVNKLNGLLKEANESETDLKKLIQNSSGGIFNNAAQVWNHDFYWNSLSPKGGGLPKGELLSQINASFSSFKNFKEEFSKACLSLFGSGWVWLVQYEKGLKIMQTSNADNPLKQGLNPLLTFDVWEHAYYIDYKNQRPKYVESFWNLVHWDFANKNLK